MSYREKFKDMPRARKILADCIKTYGLEWFKKCVLQDTFARGAIVDDYYAAYGYKHTHSQMRNFRATLRAKTDPLISDERRHLCRTKTDAQFSSWRITWSSAGVNYNSNFQGLSGGDLAISRARLHCIREVGHTVDNKFIVDIRNRRVVGDHIVADCVYLTQHRRERSYNIKNNTGFIAWLPDAVKESVAIGASPAIATRTSKGRMIKFIDRKLGVKA